MTMKGHENRAGSQGWSRSVLREEAPTCGRGSSQTVIEVKDFLIGLEWTGPKPFLRHRLLL
jgi:hypothetical protein